MSLAKVSPQPPLTTPFRRAVNARLTRLNSLTYSCEQCLTLDISVCFHLNSQARNIQLLVYSDYYSGNTNYSNNNNNYYNNNKIIK